MGNRPKTTITIAILAAAILIAADFNIYFLREGSGGFVIWNRSDAYFFIKVVREGYNVSYLRFPWVVVKQYLGAVESPEDTRASLEVIRVSSSGVERHVLKLADRSNGGAGSDPIKFTPLDGQIYVQCPPLDLCRWSGDHFDRATQEEHERLGGITRLSTTDFINDDSGWSRRAFVAGPMNLDFAVDVNNEIRLSVSNIGLGGTKNGSLSIDLLRPGKAAGRIGVFETREGRVSRADYRHAFYDPE